MSFSELRKWDIRFLELAEFYAQWSKDPSTKVGAIIVDRDRIVCGMGFNGFPRGVKDTTKRYADRELKYKLVVHAELNSILNASGSVRNCSIYVWPTLMVPAVCPECCKSVIQSGIKRVVSWKGETQPRWQEQAHISEMMLHEAGVAMLQIDKPE